MTELRPKPRVYDLIHRAFCLWCQHSVTNKDICQLGHLGLHPEQVSVIRHFCAGARAPRVGGTHSCHCSCPNLDLPGPELPGNFLVGQEECRMDPSDILGTHLAPSLAPSPSERALGQWELACEPPIKASHERPVEIPIRSES